MPQTLLSKLGILTALLFASLAASLPTAVAEPLPLVEETLMPNMARPQHHQMGYRNCEEAGLRGKEDLHCVNIVRGTYCWFETPRGTAQFLRSSQEFVGFVAAAAADAPAYLTAAAFSKAAEALAQAFPQPEPERKDPGCSYSGDVGHIGVDAFSDGHRDQINWRYGLKMHYQR